MSNVIDLNELSDAMLKELYWRTNSHDRQICKKLGIEDMFEYWSDSPKHKGDWTVLWIKIKEELEKRKVDPYNTMTFRPVQVERNFDKLTVVFNSKLDQITVGGHIMSRTKFLEEVAWLQKIYEGIVENSRSLDRACKDANNITIYTTMTEVGHPVRTYLNNNGNVAFGIGCVDVQGMDLTQIVSWLEEQKKGN